MATMSPLRRRMIDDMMVRNLSPATQQSYIYAVRKFSEYFNQSPDRLGIEDVRTYQLHLIAQQRSWSHINQVSCALRFFFLGSRWAGAKPSSGLSLAASRRRFPPFSAATRLCAFLKPSQDCAIGQR